MRSRIPIIQARAKEIITELKKQKDVLDLVLDEFAPLKEADDATSPTVERSSATCKFAIGDGEPCGVVENDSVHVHGDASYQHKFQVRKSRTKRGGLAHAVSESLARSAEATKNAKDIQPGECVQCPHPPDANVHHLVSTPGFHEFKEAA